MIISKDNNSYQKLSINKNKRCYFTYYNREYLMEICNYVILNLQWPIFALFVDFLQQHPKTENYSKA